MATLTHNEANVLHILRHQARQGDPVAVATIKRSAFAHYGIRYDSVDRALRGLVSLGKVTKPSRGNYLPTEDKG